MNRALFATLACLVSTVWVQAGDSVAQRLDALRWPFGDTTGNATLDSYSEFYTRLDALIASGRFEEAREALLQRGSLRPIDGTELEKMIPLIGAALGENREALAASRELAYDHALLWLLTGQEDHASMAKKLLLRFAAVTKRWPLYDRTNGKAHSREDAGFLRSPDAAGLWGRWHPLDLGCSWPLLRAYDILRPTLTAEERQTLEKDLLCAHKELLDRFTGLAPLYNNLWGYHLVALMRFGQVLQRADYIEEALRTTGEMFRYSYAADGFFREVTPDYYLQITSRLLESVPTLAETNQALYPEGKTFRERHAHQFRQIARALELLTLPNHSYVNLNDSWPNRSRNRRPSSSALQPGLLGVSGLARLSNGGMTAFLKFGGIRGHDHKDALGLVWYAGGREVFSDTGYREEPTKGIRFDRAWSSSTAAHQTVAVDETLHFTERSSVIIPDPAPRAGFVSQPPLKPGLHPLEAAQPAAARFNNQGRLLLWQADSPELQAMEAEQPNAYPGKISLFRRTLVMVSLEGDEGYLVDLFRVRGGKVHDYFWHGNLGESYQTRFSTGGSPLEKTLYSFLRLRTEHRVVSPFTATTSYADGMSVTSHLAAVTGTPPINLTAYQAEADAIRRPGQAAFSLLRRRCAPEAGEVETCFVWVHEVSRGTSRIRSVSATGEAGNVQLSIRLVDGRTDTLLSGDSDKSLFFTDDFHFKGRLAYAMERQGEWTGRVFVGGPLKHGSQELAAAKPTLTGSLVGITGPDEETLLVKLSEPVSDDHRFILAHIDFSDSIRFSIPITGITMEEGTARVRLAHSPRFKREGNASVMTQFPGWRVEGAPVIHLQ